MEGLLYFGSERLERLRARLSPFWAWLTRPTVKIADPAARYRAQLVMLLALVFTPLILTLSCGVAYWADQRIPFVGIPDWRTIIGMLAFLATIYLLSRAGFPKLAVEFAMYVSSLLVTLGAVPPDSPPKFTVFGYFPIIILFSHIFSSLGATVGLVMFQAALVALLLVLSSQVEFAEVVGVWAFLWINFMMIAVLVRFRNKLEVTRQEELIENEEKYRLLFDSNVHAVMIHDGDQVLLCNNAAARICGYERGEQMLGKRFADFIHPDDLKMVSERAHARLGGGSPPERYEMRILGRDGVTRWVDSHSRVILFGGQRVTMANAVEVTQRKYVEEALRYRLAFDKVITSISTRFVNLQPANTQQGIQDALATIGRFVEADHCYMRLFDHAHSRITTVHEWCAEGVAPQMQFFHQIPTSQQAWTNPQLMQGDNVYCPRVAEIPDPDEREFLQRLGTQSYAEVPMVYQGQVLGLVGVDAVRAEKAWSEDIVALLRIGGEIFASALERQRAAVEIQQRTRVLETLNELSEITASTLELEPLLDNVARLLCEALNATSAYVYDWNEHERTTTVLAEYMSQNAAERERISEIGVSYPISAAFVGTAWVVLHGDDPALPSHERDHLLAYEGKSVLRVALVAEGQQNGMIEIWESRRKREFTADEIELAQAIASQAAVALKKAYLYSALQSSEQRNKFILDALPDLVVRLDRNGRCLDFKSNDGEAARLKTPQVIGRQLEEVLPSALAASILTYAQLALRDDAMQVFEYEADTVTLEGRVVPSGRHEVLAFVRNITERKLAQGRQLELAMERERVKILEQFISDASHDLRTPIANLKSRVYLLRKASSAEAQQRQVDVIEAEILRLERLIEDLLTMSHLDSNVLHLSYQELDLNRLISEQLELHRPAFESKALVMRFEPASDLPTVLGNGVEISRLFNNLISNAINYTPAGSITVYTRCHGDGVQIEVSDTGIGIQPEDLPKVFDRFFRSDKARSTDRGGTGLGLAICKKIVELHQGMIEVESVPDQGTTFRVWLPENLLEQVTAK